MRVKTSMAFSIIFICFLVGLSLYACSGGGESKQDIATNDVTKPLPMISFTPISGTLSKGDTITQTVEAGSVQSIFSIAFDLTYDPSIIEFISADEGTFLNREGMDSTLFLTALEDDKQGRIIVGLTRLGEISDVSGSGTVLNLTFRAVSSGTTTLIFANPKVARNRADQDAVIQTWGKATITVDQG